MAVCMADSGRLPSKLYGNSEVLATALAEF